MHPPRLGHQSDPNTPHRSLNPHGERAQYPPADLSHAPYSSSVGWEFEGQMQCGYPPPHISTSSSFVPQGLPTSHPAYPSRQNLASTPSYPTSIYEHYPPTDQFSPCQPWAGFPPQYPEYPVTSVADAYGHYSSAKHFMFPGLLSPPEHQSDWINGSQEPVVRKQVASEAVIDASERRRTHPHKYWCQYCQTGFTAKHNLYRHESAHNNEKPHPCERCGSSFTTKTDLKRHVDRSKKHSEPQPRSDA